jgi:hypothetical protein
MRMASTVTAASLLSTISKQKYMMEAAIAVVKKSNDAARQEGESLVQLIENSAPQTSEHSLDVYA